MYFLCFVSSSLISPMISFFRTPFPHFFFFLRNPRLFSAKNSFFIIYLPFDFSWVFLCDFPYLLLLSLSACTSFKINLSFCFFLNLCRLPSFSSYLCSFFLKYLPMNFFDFVSWWADLFFSTHHPFPIHLRRFLVYTSLRMPSRNSGDIWIIL